MKEDNLYTFHRLAFCSNPKSDDRNPIDLLVNLWKLINCETIFISFFRNLT